MARLAAQRADRRLDLGRVSGQTGEHLTGFHGIEKRGRKARDMREHRRAQIGHDAFAQRRDHVVAQRAGPGEDRRNRNHGGKISVNESHAIGRKAEIDHPPHRDRHHQRRPRGDKQREEGHQHVAAVAQHVGKERQQRRQPHAAAGGEVAL